MKRMTFQTKVLVSTLAVFLVLLSAVTLYFSNYVKRDAQEQAKQNLAVLGTKTAQQLDSVIFNMDQTALQLAANPYIINVFNTLPREEPGNYFTDALTLARDVEDFVISFNFKQNMSARIALYNNSEDFISSGVRPVSASALPSFFAGENFLELRTYFQDEQNKFTYFIPPRKDPFAVGRDRLDNQEIFSIVREIKNYNILGTSSELGYVEVQHPMARISELFTPMDDSVAGFVLDNNDRVIYARLPEEYTEDQAQLVSTIEAMGPADGTFENDEYFLSSTSLEQLKLRVVVLQDQSIALAALSSTWSLLLVSFILIVAFTCLVEYFIIRHLTKPLKELRTAVYAIELDNLSMDLPNNENSDELQQLSNAFNHMFQKLEESIDALVLAKTGELKSYVHSLQSQMNPHFMHNLLTVISLSVSEGRTEIIPLICDKLSSMLRYTASYQDTGCTLQEEVAHTEDYLTLMKIRYEDCFIYEVDIDPALLTVPVPKYILQPLAENAFQHGFKDSRPPWEIHIRARQADGNWLLSVRDNGSGFKQEELDRFNQIIGEMTLTNARSKLPELEIGGMSLANIYIRMKLQYGSDIVFRIENQAGGGSEVTLGGPLRVPSSGS